MKYLLTRYSLRDGDHTYWGTLTLKANTIEEAEQLAKEHGDCSLCGVSL